VSVVGEILDRHLFDGQNFFARQKGIDTERGGDEQQENGSKHEAGAEFVFCWQRLTRMELLEGARGGSAGVTAGVDNCAGIRVEEEVTGAALPESNSRCRRLRSARNSAATW